MSERIHIANEPAAGQPAYAHLLPLVQALVDAGNAVDRFGPEGQLFDVDQSGYIAYLTDRIDWAWVQEHFVLPDLVRYDAERDEISDMKNWVSIVGPQVRAR